MPQDVLIFNISDLALHIPSMNFNEIIRSLTEFSTVQIGPRLGKRYIINKKT